MNETAIRSGNALIDFCFDTCVVVLLWAADLFGVSYNTINIWIFCILWPLVTIGLIFVVVRQNLLIRSLKEIYPDPEPDSHVLASAATKRPN